MTKNLYQTPQETSVVAGSNAVINVAMGLVIAFSLSLPAIAFNILAYYEFVFRNRGEYADPEFRLRISLLILASGGIASALMSTGAVCFMRARLLVRFIIGTVATSMIIPSYIIGIFIAMKLFGW